MPHDRSRRDSGCFKGAIAYGWTKMPDILLTLSVCAPGMAVAYLVLRWAARSEQRARNREILDRVYWPSRGSTDVPVYRRR